jgi:hypothetical protein
MESNPTPPQPEPAGTNWDRITAIAAVLIGLAAVVVSVYTVLLQREQIRAEVWPRLSFYYAGMDGEFRIANKGVGPAIIETVQLSVDGKPARDWAEATSLLGLTDGEQLYSTLSGTVLSPGEHLAYLLPSSPEAFAQIRGEVGRLSLAVCYCSALGECWLLESRKEELAAVDSCPTVPAELRFNN